MRDRLVKSTGQEGASAESMRAAVAQLFRRFNAKQARACAISLPPWFAPEPVSDAAADSALAEVGAKNLAPVMMPNGRLRILSSGHSRSIVGSSAYRSI